MSTAPQTPNRPSASRPLAVVTGASTGIGLELARCCADNGFDLLMVADEPRIADAARELQGRTPGCSAHSLQADLSKPDGVARVIDKLQGRPVDALLANAGRGLGQGFLDQDLDEALCVLATNVSGTVALIHRIGRTMRDRGRGRILITGSIAGFMPGSYQAVYNASKAFLDSFSYALREELKDSGVSVTCLMPGVTDTEFFRRAGLLDTKIGAAKKDDAATVARSGFDAMMQGKPGVVTGAKNKLQVAMTHLVPQTALAQQHARQAAPGSAGAGTGSTRARVLATGVGAFALLGAAAWIASRPDTRRRLRRRAAPRA